jgi:predicted RNA binding protein YcfA (HicA-like mRNA interferase family)
MNERLPALRAREVVRALERAGFAISRTSGSYCRLIDKTDTGQKTDTGRKVTVPLYGQADLKRGTPRGIIAQAGLTVAEFVALL